MYATRRRSPVLALTRCGRVRSLRALTDSLRVFEYQGTDALRLSGRTKQRSKLPCPVRPKFNAGGRG